MHFAGYRIEELYPRRTRRATALNWLLGWIEEQEAELAEEGPMPKLLKPPENPSKGHPGDGEIE